MPVTKSFGFTQPFIEDAYRGMTMAGLGVVDIASDVAPETTASLFGVSPESLNEAMDKLVDKKRKESAERGLSGLPGEIIANPVAWAAPGGGILMSGLKAGAGYGFSQPTKTDESRIINTAKSGAMGLAGGLAFKTLGKVGDKVVDKTTQIARGLSKKLGNGESEKLIAEMVAGAQKAGLSADEVHIAFQKAGKKAIGKYNKAVKSGMTKEQARIAALAEINNLPLTRPDILQDVEGHALQGAARAGLLTDEAKQAAMQAKSAKEGALRDYLRGVGKRLSGEDISTLDYTTASSDIADAAFRAVKANKNSVSQLYEAAKEAGKNAFVGVRDLSAMRRKMAAASDEVVNAKSSPEVAKLLRGFRETVVKPGVGRKNKSVRFTDLSRFRKDITAAISRADGQDQVALTRIKAVFDESMDDLLSAGKITGDEQALNAIRAANNAFKQYKMRFWGKDQDGVMGRLFDTLSGKRVRGGRVESEEFIKKMLGGKNNARAAKQLRMFKRALGVDAEPLIGKMRGLKMRELMNNTLDDAGSLPGGLTFRNRFNDALSQNKATMQELFGDEGVSLLKDASDLTFYATNIARDGANPSGSASMLGATMRSIVDMIPAGGAVSSTARAVAKPIAAAKQSSRVIKDIKNPIRPIPTTAGQEAMRKASRKAIAPAVAAVNIASDNNGKPESAPVNRYDSLTDEELLEMKRKRDEAMKSSLNVPKSLVNDEGVRLSAYKDTKGKTTVGIGFNMQSGIARDVWEKAGVSSDFDAVMRGETKITPEEAMALANTSYDIAVDDAKSFLPNFDKLSPGRQEAVVNMSYQMGLPKLSEFKGFKSAMLTGDYNKAVQAILRSRYFKQTPERARRVAVQILRG